MHHYLLVPCLAVILLLSAPSAGQEDTPQTPPSEAPAPPTEVENLLGGPSVEDNPQTDQPEMSGARRNRSNRSRVDVRTWIDTLRQLDLSKEQEVSIRAILSDYQSKMRTYQEAQGPKVRKLTEELRSLEADDQADANRQTEVRQELQRLRQTAPKAEPYQEQAMELLTDEQVEQFRDNLAEVVAEQRARRDRRRNQSDAGGSQNMSSSSMSQPAEQMQGTTQEMARSRRDRLTQGSDTRNRVDARAQRALRFLRAHQSEQTKATEVPAG